MGPAAGINEIRVVLEVDDVASLAGVLRDSFGLRELARFGEDGQEAVVLEIEHATLELGNRAHLEHIDALEADRPTTRAVRVAFGVDDVEAAERSLSELAELQPVAAPRPMPWGSVNARLETAHGLQVTLFEQHGPERF